MATLKSSIGEVFGLMGFGCSGGFREAYSSSSSGMELVNVSKILVEFILNQSYPLYLMPPSSAC